jgi:hypothetical protein
MSTELIREKACEKVDALLQDINTVNRHSFFQIKYFIVMKEPTHQARLWRCIREMEARNESLKALRLEIEDSIDNLKLIDIELRRLNNITCAESIDKEESEIQIRKRARHKAAAEDRLAGLHKKLKETEEETNLFYTIYLALAKKEPLKPYDDFESQLQMWNEKISQEFDLRGLLGLPVDLELAKTTLALDNGTPIKEKFVGKLQQIRENEMKARLACVKAE